MQPATELRRVRVYFTASALLSRVSDNFGPEAIGPMKDVYLQQFRTTLLSINWSSFRIRCRFLLADLLIRSLV